MTSCGRSGELAAFLNFAARSFYGNMRAIFGSGFPWSLEKLSVFEGGRNRNIKKCGRKFLGIWRSGVV